LSPALDRRRAIVRARKHDVPVGDADCDGAAVKVDVLEHDRAGQSRGELGGAEKRADVRGGCVDDGFGADTLDDGSLLAKGERRGYAYTCSSLVIPPMNKSKPTWLKY
jgi:hypothetical protein